jgi:hypothetical protein
MKLVVSWQTLALSGLLHLELLLLLLLVVLSEYFCSMQNMVLKNTSKSAESIYFRIILRSLEL